MHPHRTRTRVRNPPRTGSPRSHRDASPRSLPTPHRSSVHNRPPPPPSVAQAHRRGLLELTSPLAAIEPCGHTPPPASVLRSTVAGLLWPRHCARLPPAAHLDLCSPPSGAAPSSPSSSAAPCASRHRIGGAAAATVGDFVAVHCRIPRWASRASNNRRRSICDGGPCRQPLPCQPSPSRSVRPCVGKVVCALGYNIEVVIADRARTGKPPGHGAAVWRPSSQREIISLL